MILSNMITIFAVKDKKKKKEKLTIDYSYLSCEHHLAMVGGLGLIPSGDILLVGLGGGPLATYIHKYIPKVGAFVTPLAKVPIRQGVPLCCNENASWQLPS